MPLDQGTPPVVFLLLHGTFARDANWVTAQSHFASELKARFPGAIFVAPRWSGANRNGARQEAAASLRAAIRAVAKRYPRSPLFLVAHSHGGNVALYAAQDTAVRELLAGVVCIATPFLVPVIARTDRMSLRPFADVNAAEVESYRIDTFHPDKTLIITAAGDEAASYLAAAQFWRWVARRIDIGPSAALWVLHRPIVPLAVASLAYIILTIAGVRFPEGILRLPFGTKYVVAVVTAVGLMLIFTMVSAVLGRVASIFFLGLSGLRAVTGVDFLVAASPPGLWRVLQLEARGLSGSEEPLMHSLYEDPATARAIAAWVQDQLKDWQPASTTA